MRRTLEASRWGLGVTAAALLALVLAAFAAIGPVPRADAAFTTGKCAGPDITGRGASFARDAHKVFNFNFKNNFCIGTPRFAEIDVTYEPQGSGAGLTAMKERGLAPRFGMSDDPPTPAEVAQIEAGGSGTPFVVDSDPSNDGELHVIPAAVGAVAPLVNFPNGCDPDLLPASARTDNVASDTDDGLIRVRFSKAQFEGIWAKAAGFEEWHEVFDELDEVVACEKPIVRVVRLDRSGTTFAFKDYLDTINGARGWLSTYVATPDNRNWPGAEFGADGHCGASVSVPGRQADEIDQLTSGCSSGNGALVDKLVATDGSVGYSDISTARTAGLDVNPAGGDNDVYWTQIPNGSGVFTEPTADVNGFRTDGLKGSNCQAANFSNVPSSTVGDWSQVSGVNASSGFAICTFTYGLVFDDNAAVWGGSGEEEAKARTVKDYWTSIVSEGAQGQLFGNDYAPLPNDIRLLAQTGVAAVDWNKSGSGGGGGGEDKPPVDDGGGSTPPPPAPAPSNKFSLPRKTISSKTGEATISVKVPGAGQVVLVATAKNGGKTVGVGKVVLRSGKSGTFALKLKPSNAAKKLLRAKGELRVSLKVTYTPSGGSAGAMNSAVILKLQKPKSVGRK